MPLRGVRPPETFTFIWLPQDRWDALLNLIEKAEGINSSGGWQNRLSDWAQALDHDDRSIALDHRRGPRGRLDDLTWIKRQIADRDRGGWQRKIAEVFTDTLWMFEGIEAKPRKAQAKLALRRLPSRRPASPPNPSYPAA